MKSLSKKTLKPLIIAIKKNIFNARLTYRKILGRVRGISLINPNYLFRGKFLKNNIIIDAGCGFDADFSTQMIKLYKVKAIGIDPTRRHKESLEKISKETFENFKHEPIAISVASGKITFNESQNNVSGSILTDHSNIKRDKVKLYDVQSISLKDLPSYLNLSVISYIKLDLEGAEYEIINSLKKDDVEKYNQIFIEFHHHCTNYTMANTLSCVKKMKELDFKSFSLDDHNFLFYRDSKKRYEPLINKKPVVVFETIVIPHYRVPFFREIAKQVELIVVSSKWREIDGVVKATDFPFPVIETEEDETGNFHPKIISILKNYSADIYVSWANPIMEILSNKQKRSAVKKMSIKIAWMGCDGFKVRNYWKDLFKSATIAYKKFYADIYAMRKVDAFITYSSHTKKFLNISRLVPKKKIFVANNAIDTSALNEKYNELKTAGATRKPDSIIFIGRLTPFKRVDILITAFSEVVKKQPNARLTIIGSGSENDKLRVMVNNLKINDKINFMPGTHNEEILAKHLASASLFVMPGLGGLGFNTAMSCGVPIIYTNADGTEEDIFKNGVNGWYFDGTTKDLAEKIITALQDTKKLLSIGERLEKMVLSELTIMNMVKVYMDAFNKLLHKK